MRNIIFAGGAGNQGSGHLQGLTKVERLDKHKLSEKILKVVNDNMSQRGLLLKTGTVFEATLIVVPTSPKNKDKARDPEMHSSQKGNQLSFDMKADIVAGANSDSVHTVRGTFGNLHDVIQGSSLLHGEETLAFCEVGHQGIDRLADADKMFPGKLLCI